MPDAPVVTITDPNDPGAPGDVLDAGTDRLPFRLPRRVLAGLAVVAAVTAATAYALERRAEDQRQAAAFAVVDTVHVQLVLADGGVTASAPLEVIDVDPVTGEVLAEPVTQPLPAQGRFSVPLLVTDGTGGLTEVRDVQVVGTGVTAEFDPASMSGRFPGSADLRVEVPVSFSCAEVAAGRYPTLTAAVAVVVPESGREHRIKIPLAVTPAQALQACRLPDPEAVPTASIEQQNNRLLVQIAGITFSPSPLRVLSITSPGFALALQGFDAGAETAVPAGVSFYYDVAVKVTDCALARTGGPVTLRLKDDRGTYTVVAVDSEANRYRMPGSSALRAAVARSCP